jgi:hypothetical protein
MEEDLGEVVDEAHFFIEKVWKIKVESIFRTARGESQVFAVGLPNHLTTQRDREEGELVVGPKLLSFHNR